MSLNVIKYEEYMKIVFLARRFYPLVGGVEKHVLELSRQLMMKGHNIIVLTELPVTDGRDSLKDHDFFKGIEIIRIKTGNDGFLKKFRIWKEILRHKNIFAKADIIHCHDVFFWYLPLRFLLFKKAVYTTFHGYESYPIAKRAVLVRKITEKLSRGNICIGDFIGKWYGTKADVISYGAAEESRIKNQGLRIKNNSALFIGRLDNQTGILDYVKAVEIVKKKYPDFEFAVAGDGIYKNKLEGQFKTYGFIENPEKLFMDYRFAFVSRYLSILEAMAYKRLVFALNDNPVKRDYLEMAPFAKYIIIESDPQRLSEKVLYFLKNKMEEKKIISQAYDWVKDQTWEKLVQDYLGLWRKTDEH